MFQSADLQRSAGLICCAVRRFSCSHRSNQAGRMLAQSKKQREALVERSD